VGLGQGGGSDGKGIYDRLAADIFVGYEQVDLAVLFYTYGIGSPVQTWVPQAAAKDNPYVECSGATLYEKRQRKVRKLLWMLSRLQFTSSITSNESVPVPVSSRLQRFVWFAVNKKIGHISRVLEDAKDYMRTHTNPIPFADRKKFTVEEVNLCLSKLAQPRTRVGNDLIKLFIVKICWLVGGIEELKYPYCVCGGELTPHSVSTADHPHAFACPVLKEHFKSEFGDFDSTVATAKACHPILFFPSTIAL
jgi:hypothetical protein